MFHFVRHSVPERLEPDNEFLPAVFSGLSTIRLLLLRRNAYGFYNSRLSTGLIYALLALLSYSTLGLLHKIADVKQTRPAAISLLLYLSSFVYLLIAGAALSSQLTNVPLSARALGIPFGICSAIALLALQTALRFGNISTSWLAINLSAGVPTVASIVLFAEPVSPRKAISLILIVAALVLLWMDRQREDAHDK